MISSAEQYEYVIGADVDEAHPHGDLDRIVIDGEVMPKRTGVTGKKDRDGNAIPRENILRGEDVAFLMEAVGQRYVIKNGARWMGNWIAKCYRWSWQSVAGGYERVWEEVDWAVFDGVHRLTFRRKICVTNIYGGLGQGLFTGIYDGLDYVCDYALNGIDGFEPKVGSSLDSDFFTDYGYSGLPSAFRLYKSFQPPSWGNGLSSKELILSLFQTLRFLPCAYLGRFSPAGELTGLRLGTSANNPHPDIQICGFEGDDPNLMFTGYLEWGVYMNRFRTFDDQGKESWHNTTVYGTPQPSVCFFNVEASHLRAATALLEVVVRWSSFNDTQTTEKKVWFPVPMYREGEKVFLHARNTLDSLDSLKSILSVAGWKKPEFPSEETVWYHTVSVHVRSVNVLGRWDDHTSLDA